MRVQNITDMIGNTPLLKIDDKIEYYAKIEGSNLFGSVKDKAARYLIENAYNDRIIKSDTIIIESSSGNFGIALAGMCKIKGNSFICVVDPNITESNRKIIELLGAKIVVARKADKNENYVQDRIQTVKEYVINHTNAYWTNQYENEYVWKSYFSLGEELCNEMGKIDYLFVAISTCGTLAGTDIAPLKRIKKDLFIRRLQTIFFTAILACAIVMVAFGALTAPEFFPYSDELLNVVDSPNGDIIVTFDDKVTGYSCTKEFHDKTGTEVYRVNAWTTTWDLYLSNRGNQNMVIPSEGATKIQIFFTQNNGSEDVLIYGSDDNAQQDIVTHIEQFDKKIV